MIAKVSLKYLRENYVLKAALINCKELIMIASTYSLPNYLIHNLTQGVS